jgi:hypothetical protein
VIPIGCSLDSAGLARQAERWTALLPAVRAIERPPRELVAEFDPEVDEALLLEAIDVERACCPFFAIDWEPAERRLRFAVGEAEHESALDAVADALASP